MEYKNISIEWLGHSGFRINGKCTVYIDPFGARESGKADIILITHPHYDHCSLEDIERFVKPETIVLGPVDIQSKLGKIPEEVKFQMMHPGKAVIINNAKISAFPAYNINKQFHQKANSWLSYLIEIDSMRIFHAGDSDAVPEFRALKNIDIMILPVGGIYTMNADEAAELCNEVMPKLAIPMHYGSIVGSKDDALRFKKLCRCNAQIL